MNTHTSKPREQWSIDCNSESYFRTTNGHTGLCPSGAKKGDIAVVFHGAAVPFLLREISTDSHGGSPRYHLIGECYLNGFMDGRAVDEKVDNNDVYPAKRFDIV